MNIANKELQQITTKFINKTLKEVILLLYDRYRRNTGNIISSIPNISTLILQKTKFLDKIPNITMTTRLWYIVNDKTSIICCQTCNNEILENISSISSSIPKYHHNILCYPIKHKFHIDITSNKYYKNNPDYFLYLMSLVERFPYGYKKLAQTMSLYTKQWNISVYEWVIQSLPLLNHQKYTFAYKTYWILHNLSDFPICQTCKKPMTSTNSFCNIFSGFRDFCSNQCAQLNEKTQKTISTTLYKHYGKRVKSSMQIPEVISLSQQTCKRRYGCKNAGGSYEVQKKIKRRYLYDNQSFDSKPELAFYIYCKDNNINCVYHPNISFEYFVNGKLHKYYPDFLVNGKIFEIKGLQFFKDYNPKNEMILPYLYRKNKTIQEIEYANTVYEAKHQCMIQNQVQIITNLEYQKYLIYIEQKYGKKYLIQFKKKK